MATGAVALVLAANSDLANSDIRTIILNSATILSETGEGFSKTSVEEMKGKHLLNIFNAVKPPTQIHHLPRHLPRHLPLSGQR